MNIQRAAHDKQPRPDTATGTLDQDSLVTVIIPVFNEAATVNQIISRVAALPFHKEIIVVDDGSTDATANELRTWQDSPVVSIFSHDTNQGKGAAICTAIKAASGKYTLIQDADLEYAPEDLHRVLSPLLTGEAEIAYGSRYIHTSRRHPHFFSHHGVRLLNLLVRILYGVRLTDHATCYKAFRTELLQRMDLQCQRFEFCTEVTAKACRMGIPIREVSVSYSPRDYDAGKKNSPTRRTSIHRFSISSCPLVRVGIDINHPVEWLWTTSAPRGNIHMNDFRSATQQFASQARLPIVIYCATALLAVAGSVAGLFLLADERPASATQAVNDVLRRWDSEWYVGIVAEGYSYDDSQQGNVAFFPVYPILVKCVSLVSQLPNCWSGLVASHVSLLLAFVVFHFYLKERFPDDVAVQTASLLACALIPSGFFWRFAYSESTFLLLSIISMYLMHRGSSLLIIAFFVGLATATRPVGVTLLLPLFWHIVELKQPAVTKIQNLMKFVPLACWGLLAYMAFQYFQFGEPLAFAKTQQHWRLRPEVGMVEKAASYAALEPIWSVYCRDSYWYWDRLEPHTFPLLSLAFWNPIALAGSAGLVFLGFQRKWLKTEEAWLAVGLLSIPYFTRGFDFCMLSQARFSSVAFPAYITVGHLLRFAPHWLRWTVFVVAAALFTYFSARFAAGFRLI